MEYYLARSAVSRTFFRKFLPAVPRAAGRLAVRGLALRGDEFGIIRSPAAARAGNRPAHRMPTTPARQSGGGRGVPGGREPPSWRFAPIRSPGASPRSIDAAASFRAPARPARGAARFPPSGTPPKKKDGRLRSPPAFRASRPSATVPGRFSLYLYIDMLSSGCRKCAWSSSRNAATRPWEHPSLQECSRFSP